MWPFEESFPQHRADDVHGRDFDYIIVGGGTSGCVLASRLSEDPSVSVLVLEQGMVQDNWLLRVPLIGMNYVQGMSPGVVDRFSLPVVRRGGYKYRLVTGKSLGGSSRINAMLVTRGAPGGYNAWAESLGLEDWSWERVEPHFHGLENSLSAMDDPSRGHQGPFQSRNVPEHHRWYSYLEKPCKNLGLPIHSDYNSSQAPAQGYFELESAIDAKGRRVSAMSAFLNARIANERKKHLTICTGVIATKLEINAEKHVTGVHIRPVGSAADYFVSARREVILCNGAFGSPHLLLLSGIGPKSTLKQHDIHQVCELPVGKHLKDHVGLPITLEVANHESNVFSVNFLSILWQLFLYFCCGAGLLSASIVPRSVFVRTTAVDDDCFVQAQESDGSDNMDAASPRNVPNMEIMMMPFSSLDRELKVPKSIISLYPCLTQPLSEGYIELASTRAEDHPLVHFPFLIEQEDVVAARKASRFCMRLAEELMYNSDYPYPISYYTAPTVNNDTEKDTSQAHLMTVIPDYGPSDRKSWDKVTDEELDEYNSAVGITALHYSCTCRMALDPKNGVVDQKLKVHGITNLRVADTSVFPEIPSAHTMLPVMMVARRCAEFIRDEWDE